MSTPPTEPTAPKLSVVETQKDQSRQLRGTIAEELAQDAGHLNEANKNLIKFHGSYQQEDRDARKNRGTSWCRQALHVHGALQNSGGHSDRRPVSGDR